MEEKAEIRIVFEGDAANPFLIIFKPSGMPSAPLIHKGGVTALDCALQLFPELRQVSGKKAVEYGLVHRLDTETAGLLLIARTQSCFDALENAQQKDTCVKKYTALCMRRPDTLEGFPALPASFKLQKETCPLKVETLFRPYGPRGFSVRPVLPPETGAKQGFAQKKAGVRLYATLIESINEHLDSRSGADSRIFRAECVLTRGFRHQVRCHLAWLGYPIAGDNVYNPEEVSNEKKQLQLFAHTLEFPHPLTGKNCVFTTDFFTV